MKYVYIVLTDTGSMFTRMIKFFTRKPYNHVSISLDEDLETLYSFGRLKPRNPFFGGFVEEKIDEGTFALFKNTRALVLQVPVSQEEYERLRYLIHAFLEDKDAYRYNLIGVLGALFDKPITRKNRYFCSSFVADISNQAGFLPLSRSPHLVRPDEFTKIEHAEIVYEGLLRNYTKSKR